VRRNSTVFTAELHRKSETGVFDPQKSMSYYTKSALEYRKSSVKCTIGGDFFTDKKQFADINGLNTKMIAAILTTPPTFDNSQGFMFSDGTQRSSAPAFKNNPYFLSNTNIADVTNRIYNLNADFSYERSDDKLAVQMKYGNSSNTEDFFAEKNTVGFEQSYTQSEKTVQSDLYAKLFASHQFYMSNTNISTAAIFNSQKFSFERNTSSALFVNRMRNTVNWIQSFEYQGSHFILRVDNTMYFSEQKSKFILPAISATYNLRDILDEYFYFRHDLFLSLNYNRSVAEQSLIYDNQSYSTLYTKQFQFNNVLKNDELFYNPDLDLEIRNSYKTNLNYRTYQFNFEGAIIKTTSDNCIFPVYSGSEFKAQNAAKINSMNYEFGVSYTLGDTWNRGWTPRLIFSKTKSVVKKISAGQSRLPIAGFSDISANLIEGQEVGVITGTNYLQTENGERIIGSDGYPIISQQTSVIGNPNPDFTIALENTFILTRQITFSVLFDYSHGGDIWNGTDKMLSYYGLSKQTGDLRETQNYIFSGITEQGQINTTPVNFADPAAGLSGNYWVSHKADADYIEDATFLRLKEISASYVLKNRFQHISEISISLFAENVWLKTKYSGASPSARFNNDINALGLDYFNFPDMRKYGISISVKF
jgi:hypothetical protein